MIREIMNRGYESVSRILGGVYGGAARAVGSRGNLVQLAYVVGLAALTAGFISAVDFPVPNQGIVVYPGGGAETIPEAIINTFVILLGAAGIYLAFLSGRQTTNPRNVNLYLGVAMLLIATSLLTGIDLAILKGFG